MPYSKFYKLKLTLVAMLLLWSSSVLYSQEAEWQDSLDYFQSVDSLVDYLSFIDNKYFEIRKTYKGNNPYRKAFVWFENHPPFRSPISTNERLKTRRYYYLYSNTYSKLYGYDKHYLNLLKRAHEVVDDIYLLDKYAWNIELEIGHFYARKDNFDKARQYYSSIIPGLKQRNNEVYLSRLLSDMGNLYLWQGDIDAAKEMLFKAETYAIKTNNLKAIRASTTSLRSFFFSTNEEENYLKYYDTSLEAIENVHKSNKAKYLSARSEEYAKYLYSKEKYRLSLKELDKAKESLNQYYKDENRREFAKIDLAIIDNYIQLNSIDTSAIIIKKAYKKLIPTFNLKTQIMPNIDQIYDENTIVDLLDRQCMVFRHKYITTNDDLYLDSILLSTSRALEANSNLRAAMIYNNSKVQSTALNRSLMNRSVDTYYNKHSKKKLLDEELSDLRSIVNRSKNSLLNEQIIINRAIAKLDSLDKAKVDSLQNSIITLIAMKSRVMNIDSIEIEINKTKEEIVSQIGTHYLVSAELVPAKNYLEYFVSDTSVYLFTDMGDDDYFIYLGTKTDLETMIDAMNSSLLSKKDLSHTISIFHKLYNFLIPSVINLKEDIVIIPDNILHQLPFDALHDGDRYLLEKCNTEIKHHYMLEEYEANFKYESIFCVAPIYPMTSDSIDVERGGMYHLPSAQNEINEIVSTTRWSSTKLNDASEEVLLSELLDTDVFHFAGHAVASADSAYLILKDGDQYQKLHHDQILNKSIESKLVTLSACESGLGTIQHGDGVKSLSRSFLGAGAKDVTYSLWTVNDQTTASIMKNYYTLLADGNRSNIALRQAKLNFLSDSPKEFQHPYYWAAFVTTNQSNYNDKNYLFQVLIFTIVLILLILIIKNDLK